MKSILGVGLPGLFLKYSRTLILILHFPSSSFTEPSPTALKYLSPQPLAPVPSLRTNPTGEESSPHPEVVIDSLRVSLYEEAYQIDGW